MISKVVRLDEILGQPEKSLNAAFWVNRQPGESYSHYTLRRKAEKLLAQADELTEQAERLREEARALQQD